MENQQVKDVRSLYSILTTVAETYSPIQDLKAMSMFPGSSGDLTSVNVVYNDMMKDKQLAPSRPIKKKQGILQFFHL